MWNISLQIYRSSLNGLNETRLDNTIPDSQIDIEGYDILRRDRNRNGGGVAFYVAQSLTYVNRQDLT